MDNLYLYLDKRSKRSAIRQVISGRNQTFRWIITKPIKRNQHAYTLNVYCHICISFVSDYRHVQRYYANTSQTKNLST